ncbi:MAG: hypothetical protein J1E43_12350 [Christensenellaceae bacterium]|nr:hypothetical protein [Christensenellaceae bacterium]MCH5288197.1 hypothetical protein [Christensenellaceae bacterium]
MQSKGRTIPSEQQITARRRRQLRNWSILIVAVVAVVLGVRLFRSMGHTTALSASLLPCYAHQDVTPFGDSVVYYDGASIHCVSTSGGVRWSYPVGSDAQFSVSDTHLIAWQSNELFILDQNGKPSYNENLEAEIQFARIADQYAAVVIGEDSKPRLLVKDMQGAQKDYEDEAFDGMLILDVGFYGPGDQYMWTLSMDMYGPSVSTVMNLFQVGKMNAGIVSLGEDLVYKVLYDNSQLRVFTTQQMYAYDYKGVQDVNNTVLVYGWQLIDYDVPDRGDARMLMTTTLQSNTIYSISQLRLVAGASDRNFTLPSSCVGAAVQGSNLYAFAPDYLYYTNVDNRHFYAYAMPLPDGRQVSTYIGMTTGGQAVVSSGDSVYCVTLPR